MRFLYVLNSYLLVGIIFTSPANLIYDINQFIRPDGTILHAFFTPYDNVRQILVSLIKHEQRSINIASYFLTDHSVAKALKKALERNVSITIIVDHSMLTSTRHNYVLYDLAQTVNLYIFRHMDRGLMHNKFIVFEKNINDAPLTLTGSYNLTHSAQDYNFENVIISNDLTIHTRYQELFTKLLEQAVPASTLFTTIGYQNPPKYITIRSYSPLNWCTIRKPIINMLHAWLE
jgi:phosphatidylserine/phosphatidylglycerophosphate/cardiolipin synthase-like enzyme